MLDNAKQAEAADKALPAERATAARKKAAQQATDFLHGKAANPFKNQSPQDLAAIIVDTTNAYTLNERRAAFAEFARQDNAKLLDELTPKTDFDRKVNDAELPKSGDKDRLASAKQATEFLQGKKDVKNPFAGKSRDELTAIVANDTGDYTVNERRAALAERDKQEKGIRDTLAVKLSEDARHDADRETPISVDSRAPGAGPSGHALRLQARRQPLRRPDPRRAPTPSSTTRPRASPSTSAAPRLRS